MNLRLNIDELFKKHPVGIVATGSAVVTAAVVSALFIQTIPMVLIATGALYSGYQLYTKCCALTEDAKSIVKCNKQSPFFNNVLLINNQRGGGTNPQKYSLRPQGRGDRLVRDLNLDEVKESGDGIHLNEEELRKQRINFFEKNKNINFG